MNEIKNNPFFSVIIPTYNRREIVVRAIDSVLAQTETDFELILIDDGSTDETFEFIEKQYPTDQFPFLLRFHINNSGVSYARNYAAGKACGRFLAFLDSDDSWEVNKLKLQKEFIQSNENVSLLHTNETWIRNGKRVNQMKKHRKEGGNIFKRCLDLCLISPSAVVIDKEVFHQFGGFNEEFIVCEDYDLWLKITSRLPVHFIDMPLTIKYGGHEDQLSRKYFAMDYWRVKSMFQLLKKGYLSKEQITWTSEKIIEKSIILLNGYQKHNNLIHFDEIAKIKSFVEDNYLKGIN